MTNLTLDFKQQYLTLPSKDIYSNIIIKIAFQVHMSLNYLRVVIFRTQYFILFYLWLFSSDCFERNPRKPRDFEEKYKEANFENIRLGQEL